MKVKAFMAGFLCLCLFTPALFQAGLYANDPLMQWDEFSRSRASRELKAWVRMRARSELTGARCRDKAGIVTPPFFGSLGVFITLRTGGRVRGCYGAFSHVSDRLELVLARYIAGALTGDPRHEPITIAELDETEIIITVASQPVPVDDLLAVDLARYGIILTFENGSRRVFVPAEVRTIAYLKGVVAGRDCQAEAFRAVTLK